MFKFHKNRLQTQQKLGNGGFGSVFPYQKDSEDLRWVVKTVCVNNIDALLNSLPEIVFGFSCDHPCVVPVKGYYIKNGLDESKPFKIYMKLPRMKESLFNDFKNRKMNSSSYSEKEIIRHFSCLAYGLQYLHRKKIYHRDIKHNNLLLDKDGFLRIADVGIANHAEDEDWYQTLTGQSGTPHYAAPEILGKDFPKRNKGLLAKADIWSLGVVILELCVFDFKLLNSHWYKNELQENIDKYLEKLEGEGKFQQSLIRLIKQMLSLNPTERPDLEALINHIENNYPDVLNDVHNHFLALDQNLTNVKKPNNQGSEDEITMLKQQIQEIQEITMNFDDERKQLQNTISQLQSRLCQQNKQSGDQIKVVASRSFIEEKKENVQAQIKDLKEQQIGQIVNQNEENLEIPKNFELIGEDCVQRTGFSRFYEVDLRVVISPFHKKWEELFLTDIVEYGWRGQQQRQLSIKCKEYFNFEIRPLVLNYANRESIPEEDISSFFKDLLTVLNEKHVEIFNVSLQFQQCINLTDKVLDDITSTILAPPFNLQHIFLDFDNCQGLTESGFRNFIQSISGQTLRLQCLGLIFNKCKQLSDKTLKDLATAISNKSFDLISFEMHLKGVPNVTEIGRKDLAAAIERYCPNIQKICFECKYI